MSIEEVARILSSARSALFITGAGISAASGIPTYRGIGGLYGDRPTDEGIAIEAALSGTMMRLRPEVTWKYIHQIEQACRGAKPNAAHAAVAQIERRLQRAWVLTQNVDGFHAAAGSRQIIDIHGDLHRLICVACDHEERVEDYAHIAALPRCPRCGALVRPDVVLFGEALPAAKVETLLRELDRGFDVVLSIGTSSLFPYIVQPIYLLGARGAATIEINPEETPVSEAVALKLWLPAVEALEGILSHMEPRAEA